MEVPPQDPELEEPLLNGPPKEQGDDRSCYARICSGVLCRCCKSTKPLLCISLLLFGVLMLVSGSPSSQKMTLYAGENRQVITSWWTKTIDVQVITPHTTVEVDVYSLGNCPSLNGPMVSVHRDLDMTLGSGDYQYDYFNLNKGSRVEAGLYQVQGTSQVYMLQGQDKVDKLQQPNHKDPKWLDKLLQSAAMSWTVKDYYRQIVARFPSDTSDVYVLVYDNNFQTSGHLLVDLWLDLTTFNMNGLSPICGDVAFRRCPPIPMGWFSKCMIIETSSAYHDSHEEVSILIVENQNYAFILMMSLVPTLLAFASELWSWSKKKARSCKRPQEEESFSGKEASDSGLPSSQHTEAHCAEGSTTSQSSTNSSFTL